MSDPAARRGRRRKVRLTDLWERVEARRKSTAAKLAREHQAAAALFEELMATAWPSATPSWRSTPGRRWPRPFTSGCLMRSISSASPPWKAASPTRWAKPTAPSTEPERYSMELYWDPLPPDLRQRLCKEAGVPAAVAGLRADEIAPTDRDLLSWTHEELAELRIVFEPPGPWKILNQGRTWTGQEAPARVALLPQRVEVVKGRLLWSEEERRALLAMLLENVGADEAVRLAPPETWRSALDRLPSPRAD